MAKWYRCLLHKLHIMSDKKIRIIEGAAHTLSINYRRDLVSLVKSIVMPESEQNRILSVADQHDQSGNTHGLIEVRDVNFTDRINVQYAATRIRRHKPENHWEPVGLIELLHYVKKVPGVYQGRVVYALGHIYVIGGESYILSVTDNRGAIDFELIKLRPDQQFSHLAVFPEFRIIN